MKNSVIFISILISVVVDMATVDRNVVEVERSLLGEATQDRFRHSVIVSRRALNIYIFIIIIHHYFEVWKVRIDSQVLNLLLFIEGKVCSLVGCSLILGAGFGGRIIKVKTSTGYGGINLNYLNISYT